jgi:uncharacterized protein (TIGR03435 family)
MAHFGKKLALAGIAAVATLRAQSFEVASIKPDKTYNQRFAGIQFLPGGRLTIGNISLYGIVAAAYSLPFQSDRLSGGPDWVRSERFDIEATAGTDAIPAGLPAKLREEKMKLMLQTLLADRFQLTVRREMKERPVYALVVAKNGPKLQKAKIEEKDCPEVSVDGVSCHQFRGGQGQGIHAQAVDIPDVARFVSNWADRPVIDKTSLAGLFNIQTDGWVPMRPRMPVPGREPSAEDLAFVDPTRPTLFMIFDRLGLKLESQRAPIETFIIDRVERPSEN